MFQTGMGGGLEKRGVKERVEERNLSKGVHKDLWSVIILIPTEISPKILLLFI